MAASLATLTELEAENHGAYRHLFDIGRKLINGIKDAIDDAGVDAIVQGVEPMFRPIFTNLEKITNFQESKTEFEPVNKRRREVFAEALLKEGVWSHPYHIWYISTSHTKEDVNKTLKGVEKALKKVKKIT
jgi:glutamate-1-semialdehyde 2,1-aminomutase